MITSWSFRAPKIVPEGSGVPWKASRGSSGTVLAANFALLARSWALWGALGMLLGRSWDALGAILVHLEAILACLGANLDQFSVKFGHKLLSKQIFD